MYTDWLQGRARISPDDLAVMDAETNEWWTYKELNQRAENLACGLYERGVTKGDRVALLSPNDICYLDFLFACAKIGAIFVPVNWRLSATEIEYILEDCDPKVIALTTDKEELINSFFVKEVILLDSEFYRNCVFCRRDFKQPFAIIEEKDPLAIIYTNGTTGYPKGVVVTYKAFMTNGVNTILSWNLKETDVTITTSPMFHTAGLFALTVPLLMIGGKVIIQKRFDADKTINLIDKEKCTIIFMVPTMYYLLIQSKFFKKAKLTSMISFISGGAPCPQTIYKAFEERGLPFKEAYGLSEAGPNNFFISPSIAQVKKGSVGKPIIFTHAKIVDENGKEAEIGQVGELVISGNHLFKGYWNKEEETERVLVDGQLYTGDLAKQDRDGDFHIVGRKKDVIISGGENIYPLEVEKVLNQYPAVNESAVVGIPDEKWGEIVTAMVSLKPHQTATEQELQQFCRLSMGGYKIPRKIIIVERLPVSGVGKIDKRKIIKLCSKEVLAV